jgi:hypothetical protein
MLNFVIVTCLPVFLLEALEKLMGSKRDFFVHHCNLIRHCVKVHDADRSGSHLPSYRSAGYSVLLTILDQSYFVPRSSLHIKGEVSLTRTSVPAARSPLSH